MNINWEAIDGYGKGKELAIAFAEASGMSIKTSINYISSWRNGKHLSTLTLERANILNALINGHTPDNGQITPHFAQWYDNAIIMPPQYLYRLDRGGERYYYSTDDLGNIKRFYNSASRIAGRFIPQSRELIEWHVKHGLEGAERIFYESEKYGTLMHILNAEFTMKNEFDLDSVRERVRECLTENYIPLTREDDWVRNTKKDMLAWSTFLNDRNVHVMAIEIVLASDVIGVAGALDYIVEMDWNKGRSRAIIDAKSGRKGFWPSHEMQLGIYRHLWNQNFPDKEIDLIFNWAPKDWKKDKPSYNLKNQTESMYARRADLMYDAILNEAFDLDPVFVETGGILRRGEDTSVNISIINKDQLSQKHKSWSQ